MGPTKPTGRGGNFPSQVEDQTDNHHKIVWRKVTGLRCELHRISRSKRIKRFYYLNEDLLYTSNKTPALDIVSNPWRRCSLSSLTIIS